MAGLGDLAAVLAEAGDVPLTIARRQLDVLFAAIGVKLAEGGAVRIAGFGTFTRQTRAAREGRHPRTGAVLEVQAKSVVRFKASAALNERLEAARRRREASGSG